MLLTDSLSSKPYNSDLLIKRIQLIFSIINSINGSVTFLWISDHIDLSPHDAVNLAAKLAASFAKITDKPLSFPPQTTEIITAFSF